MEWEYQQESHAKFEQILDFPGWKERYPQSQLWAWSRINSERGMNLLKCLYNKWAATLLSDSLKSTDCAGLLEQNRHTSKLFVLVCHHQLPFCHHFDTFLSPFAPLITFLLSFCQHFLSFCRRLSPFCYLFVSLAVEFTVAEALRSG